MYPSVSFPSHRISVFQVQKLMDHLVNLNVSSSKVDDVIKTSSDSIDVKRGKWIDRIKFRGNWPLVPSFRPFDHPTVAGVPAPPTLPTAGETAAPVNLNMILSLLQTLQPPALAVANTIPEPIKTEIATTTVEKQMETKSVSPQKKTSGKGSVSPMKKNVSPMTRKGTVASGKKGMSASVSPSKKNGTKAPQTTVLK